MQRVGFYASFSVEKDSFSEEFPLQANFSNEISKLLYPHGTKYSAGKSFTLVPFD